MKTNKKLFTSLFIILMVFNIFTGDISGMGNIASVKAQTVYITRTGSKYHTHKCGNGTYYAASLSEAKARGLTPCKKCFPNGAPRVSSSSKKRASYSSRRQTSSSSNQKKVTINQTNQLLVKGQTCQLKIKGTSKKVSWKSNKTSVAIVNSAGKVTAKGKGTATIVAKIQGVSKQCKITVEDPKMDKSNVTLEVAKSTNVKLVGCSHSITWSSSNPSVASVKSGKIMAKTVGNTTITAKVHNRKYQCKVKVTKPEIKKISLNYTDLTMDYQSNKTLKIKVAPTKALDFYQVTAKSSNNQIVKVQEVDNGTIYLESFEKEGTATVVVKIGQQKVECNVTVTKPEITRITLSQTTLTLKPGESNSISYKVAPEGVDDYYKVQWKSNNENVVKVERTIGNYVYLKAGNVEAETYVDLMIGNEKVSCKVQVKKPEITAITLSQTSLTVQPGESSSISYKVTPTVAEYYYNNIQWKSNNETIVKIEKAVGNYVYFKAGNVEADTYLTLTIGDKTVSCKIKVQRPEVKSLSLNQTSMSLRSGESRSISYKVTPYGVDSSYIPQWTSSNENIVKIQRTSGNYAYLIGGKMEGDAYITLSIGTKSVSCKVSVKRPDINYISLSQTSLSMESGESKSIGYSIYPYGVDEYYDIQWESSNEDIVKVEKISGRDIYLRAGGVEGEAYVTLTIGSKSTKCRVSVRKPEVNSLTLSKDNLELKVGESDSFQYGIAPSGVDTYYELQWKSANDQIATVESVNGNNIFIKAGNIAGTTEITLTVGNKTATCQITVTKPEIPQVTYNLSQTSLSLKAGESSTISYTMDSAGVVTNDNVKWASNNEDIVKIETTNGSDAYLKAGDIAGEAEVFVSIGETTLICKVTVTKEEANNQGEVSGQDGLAT